MGTLLELAGRLAAVLSEGTGLGPGRTAFLARRRSARRLAAAALPRTCPAGPALDAHIANPTAASWRYPLSSAACSRLVVLRSATSPMVFVAAGVPWLILAVADPYSTADPAAGNVSRAAASASCSTRPPAWCARSTPRPEQPGGVPRRPRSSPPSPPPSASCSCGTRASTGTSMALIEFGDQAYVITPFTTDYDNILLSLSLIGNMSEFIAFPTRARCIAQAVEQGVSPVPRLRLPRRLRQPDGALQRRRGRGGALPATRRVSEIVRGGRVGQGADLFRADPLRPWLRHGGL